MERLFVGDKQIYDTSVGRLPLGGKAGYLVWKGSPWGISRVYPANSIPLRKKQGMPVRKKCSGGTSQVHRTGERPHQVPFYYFIWLGKS